MLLEKIENLSAEHQADELNSRFECGSPQDVLREALVLHKGKIAMVSSFGAESAVLLHMVAEIDPSTTVLMLETQMLFPETLAYQQQLTETLGLTDVRLISPDGEELKKRDPYDALHLSNHDACCDLRKVEPLEKALSGFTAAITGRKRFQSGQRARMRFFEVERGGRLRINPLKDWAGKQLSNYMDKHNLPRHPLVSKGYPSIGCAPCTSKVGEGEDARAGRWRGTEKNECGIHLAGNGQSERIKPMPQLITRDGFVVDTWPTEGVRVDVADLADTDLDAVNAPVALYLEASTNAADLSDAFDKVAMMVLPFAASGDGRGFSIARQLRMLGYSGKIRAAGHILVDQFRAAIRVGIDEVEISSEQAARNPEEQWKSVPLLDSYQGHVSAA